MPRFLGVKGVQLGAPLRQVESLLGPSLSSQVQGGDEEVHSFAGDISVLLRGGVIQTLRSASLWTQQEGGWHEVLRVGDSRDTVHERLGEPTDPGRLSSQQPPHYEGYDIPGQRLLINFRGDVVLGFVLSARP